MFALVASLGCAMFAGYGLGMVCDGHVWYALMIPAGFAMQFSLNRLVTGFWI